MTRASMFSTALVGAATLCGIACGEAKKPAGSGPFVGEKAAAILRDAAKVEVFRIEPMRALKPDADADADADAIEGYPLKARGKDQGNVFAGKLAAILLDDRTYSFDSAKGCIFQPGVVFRVAGGEGRGSVDVVICFDCTELHVLTRDADGVTVKQVGEDFDNARPALVKLAKDAFPDDPDIQALKK